MRILSYTILWKPHVLKFSVLSCVYRISWLSQRHLFWRRWWVNRLVLLRLNLLHLEFLDFHLRLLRLLGVHGIIGVGLLWQMHRVRTVVKHRDHRACPWHTPPGIHWFSPCEDHWRQVLTVPNSLPMDPGNPNGIPYDLTVVYSPWTLSKSRVFNSWLQYISIHIYTIYIYLQQLYAIICNHNERNAMQLSVDMILQHLGKSPVCFDSHESSIEQMQSFTKKPTFDPCPCFSLYRTDHPSRLRHLFSGRSLPVTGDSNISGVSSHKTSISTKR